MGRPVNEISKRTEQEKADSRQALTRVSCTKDEIGALAQAFLAMDLRLAEFLPRLSRIAREWERTFDAVQDALFIVDTNLKIVRLNRAAAKLIGEKFTDIVGKGLHEVLFGQRVAEENSPLCGLPCVGNARPVESDSLVAEGIYEILGTFLEDEQGENLGSIFVVHNVTLRKGLEKHVRDNSKMEAVGMIAGGVAHNFNNSLALILGNVEMSLRRLPEKSEVVEKLKNAKAAVLQARDLVQQILIYSGKGQSDQTSIDLSEVVKDSLRLIHTTLARSVNLTQEINPENREMFINADSARIQGVLINLCNNAVFAMGEKGELTVQLKMVELDAHDFPGRTLIGSGRYARLSVQDSGSGMSAETLEKIFDPFFTTKEVNEGTGMGLATVKGNVEQYGGLIKVSSTVGEGSIFELYFPVIDTPVFAENSQVQPLPRGSERVLFLDDEESLARIGAEILSEMGYQVVCTTSSTRALEIFRKDPNRFDLVITDQTMPGLTGKELVREISRVRPDLPTILCTGFSNTISSEEALDLGIKAFCMKPLEMTEFAQVVRRVLDESKPELQA
jgi:signal transduction histidine kinase/ActR/RegA family two-component response regulator